ncbi:hypothetical protein EMIHUDRAFT_467752 [Emiliania huxleyi CCMP1516]|uniref:ABC1 atypical kinase-like domain-containing protein n=2 Tax=Emiliania huxleyi TaxID=2903 RepID=A0A0D3KD75_EMIH1|nr:hypothetical protein EMIHUDRAFT_469077 [Emiliania huxleyi CCMP1516]XP_005786139.1 hypothetical protein EMIHUDRAFT_467752 [Emiliania huxleyi CCMP1516]EOD26063.1 hypothetical protein EMIHUDRAFT_469077 [Emiliania huxleyi CCMP1516]EOD33710.1 hypothetical protein EMIHUDRAFT_467752 [Emiliania huxleyi CCMP1516]|eukprot:XP_005778492.1 hypothetical protein EMIHUDRAFT_469077 [Emiliania huxleyi CCMP1516]
MLLLATATVVHTAPRAAVAGRSAPLARSSAPRLAVESVSSLEAEFEAVKAASVVAEALAPMVTASPARRQRKRDAVRGALRSVGSALTLRRTLDEAAKEIVDESCDLDEPEVCTDESVYRRTVSSLVGVMSRTLRFSRGEATAAELAATGDEMEAGWESKAQGSALKRTLEVWAFLASAALKVLKASKAKGGPEAASAAKTAAAEFIRDSLFKLGPTFVKLGQVVSTRTDVLEKEYIEVLRDLQDNVPGFGGAKAMEIVGRELGAPVEEVFDSFEEEPIAAASLGQVHRAVYKGMPVAVKVQRAGLRELFDTDLKNLKVLVKLLDKFDPKSDGADRSYSDIYEESSKLLYEEIDYGLEAANCLRFAESLQQAGLDYVRVPQVYNEVTTPRVLTLEYVPSFKLTDLPRVEAAGLDPKLLAKRTADAFLTQDGKLVYYDCGMMNELQPNVFSGFKEACGAVFGGGPFISELQLATNAKRLVDALELMGARSSRDGSAETEQVLAKSADRLAVEKLARYFIRTFKQIQQGKAASNIKTTLGADLQALTEQQVFRFPSTFTFIFRAFASVDGIGKGLDPEYDLAKFAQPFIESLQDSSETPLAKQLRVFGTATGLRASDIDTAITQPKKVAYLEQTVRAMEQGQLKIRVRSIENEQALARLALSGEVTNKLLASSILLNLGLAGVGAVPRAVWFAAAAVMGAQTAAANLKISLFDKKAAKYESKEFN